MKARNNTNVKAQFRATKAWKEFRLRMFEKQNSLDFVTGKKLYKGWNLHHADMSTKNYDKLIEDNFFALNKATHDCIHFLFRYYQKDKTILDRVKQVLDKMVELN